MKICLIGCLLCLFAIDARHLGAETQEKAEKNRILAIGAGAIAAGNLAFAKETAVAHALEKGMEYYLVQRLGTAGMTNNFGRLISDIIPDANEAIENYHILAQEQIGNKYKVLVEIRINEKILEGKLRDAGVLFAEGPALKVLFLVSQAEDGSVSYWWKDPEVPSTLSPTELALHGVFQKRGFDPINRTLTVPEGYSEAMTYPELREEDILRWGKAYSADVVIYGMADIVPDEEVSLAVKAYDVGRGNLVFEDFQSEGIAQGSEGVGAIIETLERLVSRIATTLTPAVFQAFASHSQKTIRFEVTLAGLSDLRQYQTFKDFLRKDVSGVSSVIETRVRRNAVTFAVEFNGDKKDFLNRVTEHKEIPFPLEASEDESGILFMIRSDGWQGTQ